MDFDKNKKKQFYNKSKEKDNFRRPVILAKNDRDLAKEKDKQRRDKNFPPLGTPQKEEKQPMILIKPREVSSTKENDARPQSPKKIIPRENEIEPSLIQPTKIAQNENKDKTPEVKLLTSHPTMSKPVKLIDESNEFRTSALEYLQDSNSNFLVVGVIGGQGVGKSTVLNILAHSHNVADLKKKILNSNTSATVIENENLLENSMKSMTFDNQQFKTDHKLNESFIFDCQNGNQIERGYPCTSGVDMYITKSRVILLDTGAVEGCGLSKSSVSRNYRTGSGLEVSAFLLAVCHVIILVQDWFTDVNLLRFIQSAEMVKPIVQAATNPQQSSHQNINNPLSNQDSSDSQFSGEHHPHLLFLQNKCVMDDFNPKSVQFMQDLYRKAFSKSKLQIDTGFFMYNPNSNDSSRSLDGLFHNLNQERCGKPVNLFLLPMIYDNEDKNTFRGHPTIEELARRLKSQVFGASKGQLTNVQLTERTWLLYCSKTWDNIKKSTFFIEYSRLLPNLINKN